MYVAGHNSLHFGPIILYTFTLSSFFCYFTAITITAICSVELKSVWLHLSLQSFIIAFHWQHVSTRTSLRKHKHTWLVIYFNTPGQFTAFNLMGVLSTQPDVRGGKMILLICWATLIVFVACWELINMFRFSFPGLSDIWKWTLSGFSFRRTFLCSWFSWECLISFRVSSDTVAKETMALVLIGWVVSRQWDSSHHRCSLQHHAKSGGWHREPNSFDVFIKIWCCCYLLTFYHMWYTYVRMEYVRMI